MESPENNLNNNEQNEKLNQNPENQESFESVEDMQKRLFQEITTQNKQLVAEDKKIETANDSIGLSSEEVQEEKTAMNLDVEISNINTEAEKLTNESKNQIIFSETSSEFKEESKEKETTQINLDETYIQHGIDAILKSPEADENIILRDFLKNFQTTMKVDEFKKITPYIRSEHQTINGLLRQGKEVNIENVLQYKGKELNDFNKEWNIDVVEAFHALEDCIEKSQFTVPEEGIGKKVYRVIPGDHLADFNQGDKITEKSFLSTSLDESYKEFYLNDQKEETILTIKFPNNSKVNGIFIDNVEKEFLLPRNMSYKIINKKTSIINGVNKFEIEAEFLPNEHVRVQEKKSEKVS